MARPVTIREKLERTALRLFADKGIGETSIRDIAEAADISQGALYRHYKSKDDLVVALFLDNYANLARELEAIRMGVLGFAPRMRSLCETFCALFDRDPDLFRFMLLAQHGPLSRVPPEMRTPVHVIEDMISDAITEAELPPGDLSLLAALAMGVVLQTATFHIYGRLVGAMTPKSATLAASCVAAVEAAAQFKEA